MIWHDMPSPFTGTSLPAFNLLRYLGVKHNIILISFKERSAEPRYIYDLSQYCEVIEPIEIVIPPSQLKAILYAIKNSLNPRNLIPNNFSYFNLHYMPRMQRKINELLVNRNFDLIYTSPYVPYYVQNVNLPKVIHSYDCLTET
nr:hypothetical protein [uncultured bacterium]